MRKGIFSKLILLAIGAILFGYYLSKIEDGIFLTLYSLKVEWLVGLLLLNVITLLLKTIRWHFLLSENSIILQKTELFTAVAAGFFLGLVTPGTSGEVGRVLTVDIKKTVGLNTVLLEKFFDLMVIFLSILMGITLYIAGWIYGLPVILVTLTAIVFIIYFLPLWGGYIIKKVCNLLPEKNIPRQGSIARKIHFACKELGHLRLSPKLSLFSFAVSVLLLGFAGIQFAIICHMLGINPSAEMIVLGYFVPYLAGLLSFIPMSLGVFEWSSPSILEGLFHVSRETANMSVLLYRISVTTPLIVFGFLCFGIRVLWRRHIEKNIQTCQTIDTETSFSGDDLDTYNL